MDAIGIVLSNGAAKIYPAHGPITVRCPFSGQWLDFDESGNLVATRAGNEPDGASPSIEAMAE